MPTPQSLLYFSHSWLPEHVDLNIAVWDRLWAACRFLVDDNDVDSPPYYVSRIEDLIMRADCLVAFAPPAAAAGASDAVAVISPYVLFEIALAERAGIPRLVILDRRGQIDRPAENSALVQYLFVDFTDLVSGRGIGIWDEVTAWLSAAVAATGTKNRAESRRASLLFPAGDGGRRDITVAVESCLRKEGYDDVGVLSHARDVDAIRQLRRTDLLIADLGSPAAWDVYGLAHAMAVPTIRCAPVDTAQPLPSIVQGYEAGFDADIVRWATLPELTSGIGARARAIRAPRLVIDSREEGRDYFERRRQPKVSART